MSTPSSLGSPTDSGNESRYLSNSAVIFQKQAADIAENVTVDFKKKDVLVLYQGQKTSGGYSIDIESVVNDNSTILVKKKEIHPKASEITTTVITSPYCIALIPKGKKLIIE